MRRKSSGPVLDFIRVTLGTRGPGDATDADLLERFAGQREEAAFSALVQRHGPLVQGVCRRVLGNAEDVDDAFQATFLVLVKKAGSIRKSGSVASWLHGVAYRVALEARTRAARRRAHEKQAPSPEQTDDPAGDAAARELRSILDEELKQLPPKYRAPLVLHYLAGKTKEETAQQLGWSEGTVSGRLARARDLLRSRLSRRGLVFSGSALSAALSLEAATASVSSALSMSTIEIVSLLMAGELAAGASTVRVLALTEGVVRAMFLSKLKIATAVVLTVAIGLGTGGFFYGAQAESPSEDQRQPAPLIQRPALRPLVSAISQTDAAGKNQADALDGTWVLVKMEIQGRSLLKKDEKLPRLTIKDGKLTSDAKEAPKEGLDLSKVVDASKKPKTVTLPLEGSIKFLGIYEVRGDVLRVCGDGVDTAQEKNLEGRRPKKFDSNEGLLLIFKRKTASKGIPARKAGAAFKAPGSYTLAVALTADGKLLARGGADNAVDLWDVAAGKKLHTLTGHTVPILRLAFSPDDKTLASITGGWLPDEVRGEVKLWDVASGKERVSLEGHPTRGLSLAFSPDGKTLASAAGTVKLWDVATGKEKLEVKLPQGSLPWSLAFSPDGRTLATGTGGGIMAIKPSSVILWEIATGKKRATLAGHGNSITWVGFAPDGKTLASASGPGADKDGKQLPGEIKLCDVFTAKERATMPMHLATPLQFFDLTFTADNRSLISATASFGQNDKEGGIAVQRWEVATGKPQKTFWARFDTTGPPGAGTNAGVFFAALAADGKTVAWGGAEGGSPFSPRQNQPITGTAHVWDVQALASSPPRFPNRAGKPAPRNPVPEQTEGTFRLRMPAAPTFIKPGESKTVALGIRRCKNFDEDVTLTFAGTDVPKGVTFEPAHPVIKQPDTEAEFTIQAAKDAAVGDFAIKVTAHTAKGNSFSDLFSLSVDPVGTAAGKPPIRRQYLRRSRDPFAGTFDFSMAADESAYDGKVVSTAGGKLVMNGKDGKERSYTLAANSQISYNNAACKLEDLQPGMVARVTAKKDNPQAATRIEAVDHYGAFMAEYEERERLRKRPSGKRNEE